MKRLIIRIGLCGSLGVAGCATPPVVQQTVNQGIPVAATGAEIVSSAEAMASGSPYATVAYQPDRQPASADPAITPATPYAADSEFGRPAPTAAGNVYLPVPDIPPAPSVRWEASGVAGQEGPPITLAAVEAIACSSNPTLLQANAQIEGNLGKAIQSGLWPNPTLIYQAEQIGGKGTAGEFHGGLVRQRIVTAHKLDLSREKHRARTRTAEWVALAQQYRVLNDVRIHYFRARGRQELLHVQQQLLKNAEDRVVTTQEMYNVGQATRAQVHQVNVTLQRQRLDTLMAENDFRQAFEELNALSGGNLPLTQLQTPLVGDLALINWDEALYRLLQESPQIGAARSKLEADRLTIRREIAEPVPDIIVQGGAGYNFIEEETVGAAAVQMELPVFDWNQGTIRQAEADYARQQGELRRTELSLRQQLAQGYRNYLTAVQGVRNYEEVILPEAQQAYDLRLQSYQVDRAPWMDVLDAERDFFVHQTEYILSLVAWRENEVSIMGFLLHGGLSNPPDPTPPGHIDANPQPR